MKKLLFLFLMIIPGLLAAQNYTNICSEGLTLYKKYNNTTLKGFKAVAIQIPVSGDTVFFTFPVIRDSASVECKDTTKGSVLGRKIYRKSNGYFYFFNKDNDTIAVNTQAALFDTWKFCPLPASCHMEAEVSAVTTDTVMGVVDNVKIITLQAKRSNGTNLAHPWNGRTLQLSEHYGLSKTFDMPLVPYDSTKYFVQGKTAGAIGLQDFGWEDVYNYAVGDVFHYNGYYNSFSGGSNSTWTRIWKVLAKTVHGSNDSVTYQIESCKNELTTDGSDAYEHDTIFVTYDFMGLASDSTIWRLPDEFDRKVFYADYFERKMDVFNGRQIKKVTDDKYRFLNQCWVVPTGGTTEVLGYSQGLGVTETFKTTTNYQQYDHLVYFKKGSETYGTPVATDCSTLTGVDETPAGGSAIRILPNPARTTAQVIAGGKSLPEGTQVMLTDQLGRIILKETMKGNAASLNVEGLRSGLYIVRLTTPSGAIPATAKLVIQ